MSRSRESEGSQPACSHGCSENAGNNTGADGLADDALRNMLAQIDSFDVLLEMICECALVDRRAARPDSASDIAHLWACPAGCVEFWATRHRDELRSWLKVFDTRPPPPEPGWGGE